MDGEYCHLAGTALPAFGMSRHRSPYGFLSVIPMTLSMRQHGAQMGS